MTTTARQQAADAALAAVVIGVELAASLAGPHWHGAKESQPGTFGIILIVTSGLALLARRRYPGAVLAIVLAATLGANALGAHAAWLGLIVAFFTAVRRGRRAAAIASLVIGYGASVWNASAEFGLLLAAGLVTLLSCAELSRVANARAAADRRGREEAAARRASDERLAIARDLHDVVAHSISVINVQANTALHLMDRQPDRAREALTAIREVSGQALSELGSVLGALRDTAAPLAPTPGVARLDDLAARARAAGFAVSVAAEGPARPLPAGVDAAAYRIVQEALTNAVRHSGGRAASVLLRYSGDDLVIEVSDDGGGSGAGGRGTAGASRAPGAPGAPGSGNGLAGMAERARALGGTVDAGARPGGGFRVLARLPGRSG
jgi:signal transduction histidine kinase